ncbi:Cytochrome P450 [Lentzea flava]|nr:Cytochrome P450 [Lentzea flava]
MNTSFNFMQELAKPQYRGNPYPLLNRLRESDPVHRTVEGFYLIGRHEHASKILRNARAEFVKPDRAWLESRFPDYYSHHSLKRFSTALTSVNPPDHTRLRRILARYFTTWSPSKIQESMERRCAGLLNDVAARLRDGEEVDFHRGFSEALTIATVGDFVGVPEEDRARLVTSAYAALRAAPEASSETLALADEHSKKIDSYLVHLISQRKAEPRDDLTSFFARMLDDGIEEISEDEVIATLWILWVGGFHNASASISHGIRHLLSDRGLRRWMTDDVSVSSFVNETLRYNPALLITPLLRIAVRDVDLGEGIMLRSGSGVRVVIGAANRDPEMFTAPDIFDPTRDNRGVLSFGLGPNFCPGASLARLQMATALRQVVNRFPGLAVAAEPTWSPLLFNHQPLTLPVVLREESDMAVIA